MHIKDCVGTGRKRYEMEENQIRATLRGFLAIYLYIYIYIYT